MRGESKKKQLLPVIIWATGTISKSFRKYPGNVPGKQEIKQLQKTAIPGTANTAESAYVEAQNVFNMRNSITYSTNHKYTTAATLHPRK